MLPPVMLPPVMLPRAYMILVGSAAAVIVAAGIGATAWLVAPASTAFSAADADVSFPLWILDADGVAQAATDRFAPPPAAGD